MNKTHHFITGLPRSGSTLLSSILRQNPRFHASITDPLANLVKGVIEHSQDSPGMKSEVPVARRKNLVRHLFEGYYEDVDRPVVFNTNRAWTYLTNITRDLYPKSKHIVCVRDINWVEFAKDSISGYCSNGYGAFDHSFSGFDLGDIGLAQMRADSASLFNLGIYVTYLDPHMLKVETSAEMDVLRTMQHLDIKLLVNLLKYFSSLLIKESSIAVRIESKSKAN